MRPAKSGARGAGRVDRLAAVPASDEADRLSRKNYPQPGDD
jgi:hypothetical protein